MKRVDDAFSQVGDSNDPDVVQAKRDVANTHKRAQNLIEKLDSFIGRKYCID